jgi:hypothetical protein
MNWRIVRLEQYAFYHTQIAQDRAQNKHAPATRPGWPLEEQLIPPDAFDRCSPASSYRDRRVHCEFDQPGYTAGQCLLEVEGVEPCLLRPADLALLPHGAGHRLMSDVDVPPGKLFELPREKIAICSFDEDVKLQTSQLLV